MATRQYSAAHEALARWTADGPLGPSAPSRWVPMSDAVLAAVESLPARYRAVLEGIYWEGVTQDELADRLEVSRTTLCRHRGIALSMVRDHMAAQALVGLLAGARWGG